MTDNSNPTGYVNHQLNDSASKAAFTFSKEKRFHTPQQHRFNDLMYLPPVQLHTTKSISFGYGKKTQLVGNLQSPSPDRYVLKSDFQLSKLSSTKGFSFGVGRQKTSFGDPLSVMKKTLPGVGSYTLDNQIIKCNGGYMGAKLNFCSSQNRYLTTLPGPGTYNVNAIDISHSGSYVLSKYKNPESSSYRFKTEHQTQDKLKQRLKKSLVGPGTYREMDSLNPEGTYKVSTHISKRGQSFTKSQRRSITEGKDRTPTPGKYDKFSIFGRAA